LVLRGQQHTAPERGGFLYRAVHVFNVDQHDDRRRSVWLGSATGELRELGLQDDAGISERERRMDRVAIGTRPANDDVRGEHALTELDLVLDIPADEHGDDAWRRVGNRFDGHVARSCARGLSLLRHRLTESAAGGAIGTEFLQPSCTLQLSAFDTLPFMVKIHTGYWALLANPDTYRVAEAVAAFQTDLWTVKGDRLAPGDRVIVWQAQGSGRRRGIVALGEVLEPARLTADAENPFWIDRARAEAEEERVRIRYVVSLKRPLWPGELGNEFLQELSVTQARGGTVFRVTPEQWTQVLAAAGGWDDRWWYLAEDARGTGALRASRGQGRGLSAAERKVIDDYAMARAKAYLRQRQIPFHDVSQHQSHDLHGDLPDRTLYVKVKGTMSAGESILLTFNEVELVRREYPNTILFVTSGIVLDRSQSPPVASGGSDQVFDPWQPNPDSLQPLTYECWLRNDQRRVSS
jgi:predicted RNA-binding protein with PUA-like domain